MLAETPVEYWHGLTAIELRARTDSVGEPFAFYRISERIIVLYSLPRVWALPKLSRWLRRSLRRFTAEIEEDGTGVRVSWPSPALLAVWFYCEVLTHELGHHKRNQYRQKIGRLGRLRDEETVADLHAGRLTHQLFARVRAKRASR